MSAHSRDAWTHDARQRTRPAGHRCLAGSGCLPGPWHWDKGRSFVRPRLQTPVIRFKGRALLQYRGAERSLVATKHRLLAGMNSEWRLRFRASLGCSSIRKSCMCQAGGVFFATVSTRAVGARMGIWEQRSRRAKSTFGKRVRYQRAGRLHSGPLFIVPMLAIWNVDHVSTKAG